MESICPGCGYPLMGRSTYHHWPQSMDRTTSIILGKARLICNSCNTILGFLYPNIGDVDWTEQKTELSKYYSRILKEGDQTNFPAFLLYTMFLYGRTYTVLASNYLRGKSIVARQYRLETDSNEPIGSLKAKTHFRSHQLLRSSKVEDITSLKKV